MKTQLRSTKTWILLVITIAPLCWCNAQIYIDSSQVDLGGEAWEFNNGKVVYHNYWEYLKILDTNLDMVLDSIPIDYHSVSNDNIIVDEENNFIYTSKRYWSKITPDEDSAVTIKKFDDNGGLIWQKDLQFPVEGETLNDYFIMNRMEMMEDGNLFLYKQKVMDNNGLQFDSTIFNWVILDQSSGDSLSGGTITWYDEYLISNIFDHGNDTLTVFFAENVNNNLEYHMVKVTYEGNVISDVNLYNNGALVTGVHLQLENGDFICTAGASYFYRISSEGELLNTHPWPAFTSLLDFEIANDHEVYFLTQSANNVGVLKFDYVNYEVLWGKDILEEPWENTLFGFDFLTYTSNDHLLVHYDSYNFMGNGPYVNKLIKVDSSGNFTSIDVWPGDANSDGTANMLDVFPIGIGYGSIGPVRPDAANSWEAQPVDIWTNSFSNNSNYAHADCDGNGTINAMDGLPILLNYGLTHNKTNGLDTNEVELNLFFNFDEDTVLAGEALSLPIHLGEMDLPAEEVYGIALTINFDPSLVDTNSIEASFDNSWLGTLDVDLMAIQKKFSNEGQLHIGMVRTDQNNITSNYGQIATLQIVMEDDLAGKQNDLFANITLSFSDVKLISFNESEKEVSTTDKSLVIKEEDPSSVESTNVSSHIQLYPEPVDNMLTVISNKIIERYSLSDISGKQIMPQKYCGTKQHEIELSNLTPGIYFLTLELDDGAIRTEKVIKN